MNNVQEKAALAKERTFLGLSLGLPTRSSYMAHSLFWGGVLFGMGLGIFLCAALVGFEVLRVTPDRWDHWASLLVIALVLTGQYVAQRAVHAKQQT
jgi:hypothetical protein